MHLTITIMSAIDCRSHLFDRKIVVIVYKFFYYHQESCGEINNYVAIHNREVISTDNIIMIEFYIPQICYGNRISNIYNDLFIVFCSEYLFVMMRFYSTLSYCCNLESFRHVFA